MEKKLRGSFFTLTTLLILSITLTVFAAYKSHLNDADTVRFLQAYPNAQGTKADNCFLCHTGGTVEQKYLNACNYCHAEYGYKAPHPAGSISKTLNPFGVAYRQAGRNVEAFAAIAGYDSDQDGVSNEEEINQACLPGDKFDRPDSLVSPAVIYTREMLYQLPRTSQFMVVDTAKAGDYFATYTGVHIWQLLQDAGILDSATDIIVYSVDGYSSNFSVDELQKSFEQGIYVTKYPWIKFPEGAAPKAGQQIPGKLCYLLAYESNGYPLLAGKLVNGGHGDKVHLSGEGPYRFIAPLTTGVMPDRSQWSMDRDESPYPYNPNRPVLKNSDYCIKATVAIQVNTADNKSYQYDWSNKAWQMIEQGELVIYGAIKQR